MKPTQLELQLVGLVMDGVRFREAVPTLNEYLQRMHSASIVITGEDECLVLDMKDRIVHRSHSFTSCLEFALKLPLKGEGNT